MIKKVLKLDNINYYAFVLGYDLLSDEFKNSPNPECDLTYEFCYKIAKKYLDSDYFNNSSKSGYEMLEKYVNDNRFKILKEYENFIGIENLYFEDNKKLLEKNIACGREIALVEWGKYPNKEYIIAIDYNIDKNRIYWGQGHYYNDLDKAKEDFFNLKHNNYIIIKNNEKLNNRGDR